MSEPLVQHSSSGNRHEKTFFNPTALAATVSSDISDADLEAKLKVWNAFQFERVGLNLRPELVALKDVGGDAAAFAAKAKTIAETSEFNLVLMTEDMAVMKAGVEVAGFKRPLLYAATEANADDLLDVRGVTRCVLGALHRLSTHERMRDMRLVRPGLHVCE